MPDEYDYVPAAGDSFRLHYGDGNRGNKLIHVRGVIDNEYIVYRYWDGAQWIYQMTDPTFFEVGLASKHVRKVKG